VCGRRHVVATRPAALVLWDVDGTLIRAGPAGRLAFADAIEAVLGTSVAHDALPRMAGKTDRQIAL